ncbi:MAG: paraquat-inducible protein [Planctomycetota bacterium]|nr:MAG: paraquat-inducible protein [Planctomycetota bacterium]
MAESELRVAPGAPTTVLRACGTCGLVQRAPAVGAELQLRCARCSRPLDRAGNRRRRQDRARALAFSALLLLPVALCLPLLRVERFGRVHETSLLEGTAHLLREGPLAVGLVVALCSLVLPTVKLLVIVLLAHDSARVSPALRARLHHLVELTGRWGLLDVLLVAVLVASLKLEGLVELTAGPGALAFLITVMLSLGASACFDPRDLWDTRS